jgi:hypothetical protein
MDFAGIDLRCEPNVIRQHRLEFRPKVLSFGQPGDFGTVDENI